MTCRGVLDALSDYLEGDAGKSVCKELEEHIRGCERCRLHIDAMKKMIRVYKNWRKDPIPDDVSMRLYSALARECDLRCAPSSRRKVRTRKQGRKKI